jgi:hypothetical protein
MDPDENLGTTAQPTKKALAWLEWQPYNPRNSLRSCQWLFSSWFVDQSSGSA